MVKSRKLRVGIIGSGGIAQGPHAEAWNAHPDVEVVATCDVNLENAQKLADKTGAQKVFANFKELVKLKDVDIVDICTPNKLHTPAALAALNAGKHVVCEKPLAVTTKEVRQMGELADKKKLKLMTAQHQRFRPESIACKRLVDDGALGKPFHAHVVTMRRDLQPTRPGFICKELSGGGVCMDMGVHTLDLAMWLLGFPNPVRVTGTIATNFAKGHSIPGGWGEWNRDQYTVEDFASGFVTFDNGMSLVLQATWLNFQGEREVLNNRLYGTGGTLEWPEGKYHSSRQGVLFSSKLEPLPGLPAPHTGELHAFYDCVTNNTPSPVPWTQTIKVIGILEGIYKSQSQGKEIKLAL